MKNFYGSKKELAKEVISLMERVLAEEITIENNVSILWSLNEDINASDIVHEKLEGNKNTAINRTMMISINYTVEDKKKDLRTVYNDLYKKHLAGWTGVKTKEDEISVSRESNKFAINNTAKEWRKQWD